MKTSQFVAMLLAIFIAVAAIVAIAFTRLSVSDDAIEFKEAEEIYSQVKEQEKAPEFSVVNMLAVGDNLIHKPIYQQAQARTSDGSYDFMPVYQNLAGVVSGADIAVINQETMMAGSFDVSTYPCFNTPTVMASQLASLGFDVLTIANNHMLDKQSKGLIETLDLINATPGLTCAGAFHGSDEYTQIKPVTVNGISFVFLSYTEHTNGITIPEEKESYIVYLDELDVVEKQVKYAESVADVVVVSMHAGIEYSDDENDVQRNFAQNVVNWGADIVIGTHPHTLQPVEYLTNTDGKEVPVLYSLGNFVSAQDKVRRLIGGMANITFAKNSSTGEVTVSKPQLDIVITHYGSGFSGIKLYRLADYTDSLAASHGNSDMSIEYIYNHIRKVVGDEYLIDEYKSK